MQGQIASLVRWVILTQLILTAIAAVISGWFWSWDAAALWALGGVLAMISTVLFALRAFAVDASDDPDGALRSLYRGTAIKWLVAIFGFAVALKFFGAQIMPMLLGYLLAGLSYKLALLKSWPDQIERAPDKLER